MLQTVFKSIRVIFFLSIFFIAAIMPGTFAQADSPHVDVITINGVVNPVLANYIDRGINQAEDNGAVACIIILDTPGGLLSSTEDIVDKMDSADIPIVAYVNHWAGSAGTFITLAADVAAISPRSRIGAASPVSGDGQEMSETMKSKVTQDTAAWIEAIADEHGRNSVAAIAAVAEAASYTYDEALGLDSIEGWEELGLDEPYLDPPLVDIGAEDLDDLLTKLGEGITLVNGEQFSIPQGVITHYTEMSTGEDFLYAISDPNIAYILMSLAMLGLLVELSHPGLIFPGIVGGVFLLLSIYSLGVLDANWAGVLLILLAMGLFIAEVVTTSFGLFTAGGVVSLVIGSLILFSGTPFSIDPWLIATVAIFFTSIFLVLLGAVVRSQRRPITTGREALIGKVGIVDVTLDPRGIVWVWGERWNALSEDGTIELGEEVTVTGVEGLRLNVVRKSK